MKQFKQGNWSTGDTCLICNTAKEGEVTLVGIPSTREDNVVEVKQIHVDCLDLNIYPSTNGVFIAQFVEKKENEKS